MTRSCDQFFYKVVQQLHKMWRVG